MSIPAVNLDPPILPPIAEERPINPLGLDIANKIFKPEPKPQDKYWSVKTFTLNGLIDFDDSLFDGLLIIIIGALFGLLFPITIPLEIIALTHDIAILIKDHLSEKNSDPMIVKARQEYQTSLDKGWSWNSFNFILMQSLYKTEPFIKTLLAIKSHHNISDVDLLAAVAKIEGEKMKGVLRLLFLSLINDYLFEHTADPLDKEKFKEYFDSLTEVLPFDFNMNAKETLDNWVAANKDYLMKNMQNILKILMALQDKEKVLDDFTRQKNRLTETLSELKTQRDSLTQDSQLLDKFRLELDIQTKEKELNNLVNSFIHAQEERHTRVYDRYLAACELFPLLPVPDLDFDRDKLWLTIMQYEVRHL